MPAISFCANCFAVNPATSFAPAPVITSKAAGAPPVASINAKFGIWVITTSYEDSKNDFTSVISGLFLNSFASISSFARVDSAI